MRRLGKCGVGPGRCPNDGLVQLREGDAPICAAHLACYLLPIPLRVEVHARIIRGELT